MASLSEDDTVSSIEKDLLLSYTRQFYDAVINDDTTAISTPPKRVTKVSPPAPKKVKKEAPYTPPRVVEIPASIKELEKEVKTAPIVKQTPPAPKAPKPTPPPPPPATKPLAAKFKKLFIFKEPKELSERLSQSPIKDLTKALAINDRLLYVSQLFDNQQTNFTVALNHLNQLNSYDEAVSYLSTFAEENDWTDEEKIDTATSFAKLVKRRYK